MKEKEVVRMILKARFCAFLLSIVRKVPFHAIQDDAVIYLSSAISKTIYRLSLLVLNRSMSRY